MKIHKRSRFLAAFLAVGIFAVSTVIPSAAQGAALKLDRTEYMQGEEILAHYTGTSNKDWVAIYQEGNLPGGPWADVYEYTSKTGQPDGTMDFKEPDRGDVTSLAPGNYVMYLLKDDGYTILDQVPFTITSAEPSLSSNKAIYPKGETPVFCYTASTHPDAWIGVYPAENKTPGDGNPSLVYQYTRESGQPSGSTDLRNAEGTSAIEDLPAGEYYAYLFADGGYTITAACAFTLTEETSVPSLSTDKEIYGQGETPVFRYTDSVHPDAWIGIYPASNKIPGSENPALIYKYTRESGQPDGSTDLKQADGTTSIDKLPSGEYYAYLFADGGYTIMATCMFTLKNNISAPSITSDQAVYTSGDQVAVSYTGSTHPDAWIGIYPADRKTPGDGNPSLIYKYTRESGQPGGVTDFKQADGTTTINQLPAGDYYVYLFADGGYTIVATCTFSIKNRDLSECQAPKAVQYNRTAARKGYADGSVTITAPDQTDGLTGYALFWGNDSGIFEDYTEIPVTAGGASVVKQLNENIMIPYGATRLYAYSVYDGKTLSPQAAVAKLPEGIAAEEETPLYSFQAISDAHIQSDPNHLHNQHLRMALADIEKNDPDSIGIFNSGDVADSGDLAQYRQYNEIVNSFSKIPYIYCTPGNHDLKGSDYSKEINDFLEGTNAPSAYYSKQIGDATFILLGSQIVEPADCHAQLNQDQLDFLKAELEKASDGTKPIFVFLHQPLYNTVSGTLPGQNWDGVYQEKELREIFKQYPQVIFITGHTHWELDSKSPMYVGNGTDATMFNDASVGYLWTDAQTGKEGSQGYYVEVYSDHVLVRGRDFVNGKWVAGAQFIVDTNKNLKGLTAQISEEENGLIGQTQQIKTLLDEVNSLPRDQAADYQAEREKLSKLYKTAQKLAEQVEAVKEAVNALSQPEKITLDEKAAVEQAAKDYNALTAEQKVLLGDQISEKLDDLTKAIQELEKDPGGELPADPDDGKPTDPDDQKPANPDNPSTTDPDHQEQSNPDKGEQHSNPNGQSPSEDENNPQTSVLLPWGAAGTALLAGVGCYLAKRLGRRSKEEKS